MIKRIIIISVVLFVSFSCKKEDPFGYEIEYQNGYPSEFAGNWRAVDFLFTNIDIDNAIAPIDGNEYNLVTALDPADKNKLIIDNIYNSNLRVRTFLDKAEDAFYINKGKQLEKVNNQFDIKTISIRGVYLNEEQSGELLYFVTGLYDQYNDLFDTIVTIAFRKIGFEDLEEYEYDFIFENSND